MLYIGYSLFGLFPSQMSQLCETVYLEAFDRCLFNDCPSTKELLARVGAPGGRRDEIVELSELRVSFGRAVSYVAEVFPHGIREQLQRLFWCSFHIRIPSGSPVSLY